jgi:hypothetical protein
MAVNFNWTCPYCNRDATITASNFSSSTFYFNDGNKDGLLALISSSITCPNDDCKEYTISSLLYKATKDRIGNNQVTETRLMDWRMKPNSSAKPFPDYIPNVIISDYNEACLIRDLSPKASATLSRRCLQGIIRDYFSVVEKRLIDEINAIKDKMDPLTWGAIDAVRKIGNIGAHMEKDIDLIIDVEPEEAQLLIGLIEILLKDLYITRHERQKHLENIIGVAAQKADEKVNGHQ